MSEHQVLTETFEAHEYLMPDLPATTSGIRGRSIVRRRRHRIALVAQGVAVAVAIAVPVSYVQGSSPALPSTGPAAPGGVAPAEPSAFPDQPFELDYVPAGMRLVAMPATAGYALGGYRLFPVGHATYSWNDPSVQLDRVSDGPAVPGGTEIPKGAKEEFTVVSVTVGGAPAKLERYASGARNLILPNYRGQADLVLTIHGGQTGEVDKGGEHSIPSTGLSEAEVLKIAEGIRWTG